MLKDLCVPTYQGTFNHAWPDSFLRRYLLLESRVLLLLSSVCWIKHIHRKGGKHKAMPYRADTQRSPYQT